MNCFGDSLVSYLTGPTCEPLILKLGCFTEDILSNDIYLYSNKCANKNSLHKRNIAAVTPWKKQDKKGEVEQIEQSALVY